MRKVVKSKRAEQKKSREDTYSELGEVLNNLYLKAERAKVQDFTNAYARQLREDEEYIEACVDAVDSIGDGVTQKKLLQNMKELQSGYLRLLDDAQSKFKIYVRGIGNAGKSTLVNTLLRVTEQEGSKTGKIPETFIIEAYSDRIPYGHALVYQAGNSEGTIMSRKQAKELQQKEVAEYLKSEELCEALKDMQLKRFMDEEERKEREQLIYEKLNKTTIRQIEWGIEENAFLQGCILCDTPGLMQELRHTNELEDVQSYEADGILWVFSQKHIIQDTHLLKYKEEVDKFGRLNSNDCMIAVVNVHSESEKPGSKGWKDMETQSEQRLAEFGLLNYFRSICYVNVKKAYDGIMTNDAKKIKESNIESLYAMINERFIEVNSDFIVKDRQQKYHDYMRVLKQKLGEINSEIKKFERQYIDKESQTDKAVLALEAVFENDLIIKKKKHMSEVNNQLDIQYDKFINFETWTEEQRSREVSRLANLESLNKYYYEIYIQHISNINEEAKRLADENIVSRFSRIGAEVFYETHPVSIKSIKKPQMPNVIVGSFDSIFEGLFFDIGHSVTKFFQGEERARQYAYDKKYKKAIKKALSDSADEETGKYINLMREHLDELEKYFEDNRKNSFKNEIGEWDSVDKTKERIKELMETEKKFDYEERSLEQLIFDE